MSSFLRIICPLLYIYAHMSSFTQISFLILLYIHVYVLIHVTSAVIPLHYVSSFLRMPRIRYERIRSVYLSLAPWSHCINEDVFRHSFALCVLLPSHYVSSFLRIPSKQQPNSLMSTPFSSSCTRLLVCCLRRKRVVRISKLRVMRSNA